MTDHPTRWRRSSFSVNTGQCVELAQVGGSILLRDSKHPEHGHLTFSRAELAALVTAAKAGELDGLA
jgi:hypothetical protein